jgi:regulator of RNase E activity RraB
MTESEIRAIIRGHEKRNAELLRSLRLKGVALNEARPVEHHFWANSQGDAALLARELYDRGYLVLAISPVTTVDGAGMWNVEAGVEQTPSVAASRDVTEELSRLAARSDSVYDGWGTSI